MMCDVYVYKDCGCGWTTQVAGNKLIVPPIPKPPFGMVIVRGAVFDKESRKMMYDRKVDKLIANITSRLYQWLCKPHEWSLRIIPRRYIGLPHDGDSFNHETAAECANNLKRLRAIGYRVPQYAIDAIMEEGE